MPVLGLVDDAILIPLGVWLFEKLIPQELMAEHRATAEREASRPVSRWGILIVLAIWACAALLAWSVVATSGYN